MTPALRTEISQSDFSEGMNRDVAPELIPPDGAYDMVNVLLDEDGSPYRRGGTAYRTGEGLGTKGLTWIWDGYLKPGARTLVSSAGGFGALGLTDEAIFKLNGKGLTLPKQSAVLEDMLFIGGYIYAGSRKTAIYSHGKITVENGSKVVTGLGSTWNTLVDAGMLFHIAGDSRVYVVASIDSTTQLTLRDAYEGASGEGKSHTLNPIWAIGSEDGYQDEISYYTVCANRIVSLAQKISFTEIDNPHSYVNQFGTVNEHSLPQGVQGVGLATVGQTVLIFTTAGVWTLDGLALDIVDQNGNPQHRLQQLSSDIVLAGAAGIADSGQQLVIPALDGIFLMDGISQPQRISRPIDRLYRSYIEAGYIPGQAKVSRSHYFLPILDSLGAVKDNLVCRLDRPSRSRSQTIFPWSRLSGDGGEIRAYTVRVSQTTREPLLLGAQAREPSRVVDCSAYFAPDAAHKNDADGSTHDLEIVTRDYETGGMTENVIRLIRARYLLKVAIDGEDPTLKFWRSDGGSTGAKWGEKWGAFKWAGPGAFFAELTPAGEESDGRGVHKCRVNKKARFQRFRLRTEGACASCVIRSLEIFIRPSAARRR